MYEIAFSRVKIAAWPPLHAKMISEDRTLCGISTAMNWDFDGGCMVPEHVECKRCLRILAADTSPPPTPAPSAAAVTAGREDSTLTRG